MKGKRQITNKQQTTNNKRQRIQARGFVVAVIFIVALIFAGCPSDTQPPSEVRSMRIFEAPSDMLSNIDTTYRFIVIIEGEGAEADSILCSVIGPDNQPVSSFALVDDGSLQNLWGPDYAGTSSGDIVPNDLRYTRRVSGLQLANGVTGSYRFEFTPHGNFTVSSPPVITVRIEDVQNCVVLSSTPIPAMGQCEPVIDVNVIVQPDASDNVDSVRLQIYDGEELLAEADMNPNNTDTAWSFQLFPSFIRCIPTGLNYSLAYIAETRFGLTCVKRDSIVPIYQHLAVVWNSIMPDTIFRPVAVGDTDTVIVTVNLDDCELAGATDFYGLQFESRREDIPGWGRDTDFYLRDDGSSPDAVAGNGVYTVGLTFIRRDELPNYVYYFRYYAIEGFLPDCVPFDTSAYLVDSVRVIQPGVLMGGGGEFYGGVDFGIVNGNGR